MELAIHNTTDKLSFGQTVKAVGLTLQEIAHRFNSPVTEENAWAVCYLWASKLAEMQWNLASTTFANTGLDNVVITTNGSIELLKEKGNASTSQDDMRSVIENLGVMIYSLLDYGLPDDQERTLSLPLESLIEMMTELNMQSDDLDASYSSSVLAGELGSPTSLRTRDSGITVDNLPSVLWGEQLGRVLKACELHVIEVADPYGHFRGVCRGMVEEAINIIKLDVEGNPTKVETSQTQMSQSWQDVMAEVRNGVQLKQVVKAPGSKNGGVKLTDFDFLLMSIAQFDKSELKRVQLDESGKPLCDHPEQSDFSIDESLLSPSDVSHKGGRRASVGDVHSKLMNEIRTRNALKPVSQRKLRPLSLFDRPLTPMESLLEEILTPPPLKKVERTSPKRLSMSLECYRMCKSNPNLLDIQSASVPFAYPQDSPPWYYGWKGRNMSLSMSPLGYGIPSDQESPTYLYPTAHSPFMPPSPHSLTHSLHSPTTPNKKGKSKKTHRGSLFQRFVNKLSHSSKRSDSMRKRRMSCPDLLDEDQPMVMVTPCDSAEYYSARWSTYGAMPQYASHSSLYEGNSPNSIENGRSEMVGSYSQTHQSAQIRRHSLNPLQGEPLVAKKRKNSRKDRVKSWAFCDDLPRGSLRGPCDGTIEEESRSQVWNVPESNVNAPAPQQSYIDIPLPSQHSPGLTPPHPVHTVNLSPYHMPPMSPSLTPPHPRQFFASSPHHSPHVSPSRAPPQTLHTFTASPYHSPHGSPSCAAPHPLHTYTSSPHHMSPNNLAPLAFSHQSSRTPSPHHVEIDSPAALSDVSLQLSQYDEPTDLNELVHIRFNVTNADLYNLQLEDSKVFKSVSEEKVCFSCRKTKFSMMNHSHQCYVCKKRVCSKCSKKYPLRGSSSLSHANVTSLFKDAIGDMKAVLLCTPCLLYVCPEASQKCTAKRKHKQEYDC